MSLLLRLAGRCHTTQKKPPLFGSELPPTSGQLRYAPSSGLIGIWKPRTVVAASIKRPRISEDPDGGTTAATTRNLFDLLWLAMRGRVQVVDVMSIGKAGSGVPFPPTGRPSTSWSAWLNTEVQTPYQRSVVRSYETSGSISEVPPEDSVKKVTSGSMTSGHRAAATKSAGTTSSIPPSTSLLSSAIRSPPAS